MSRRLRLRWPPRSLRSRLRPLARAPQGADEVTPWRRASVKRRAAGRPPSLGGGGGGAGAPGRAEAAAGAPAGPALPARRGRLRRSPVHRERYQGGKWRLRSPRSPGVITFTHSRTHTLAHTRHGRVASWRMFAEAKKKKKKFQRRIIPSLRSMLILFPFLPRPMGALKKCYRFQARRRRRAEGEGAFAELCSAVRGADRPCPPARRPVRPPVRPRSLVLPPPPPPPLHGRARPAPPPRPLAARPRPRRALEWGRARVPPPAPSPESRSPSERKGEGAGGGGGGSRRPRGGAQRGPPPCDPLGGGAGDPTQFAPPTGGRFPPLQPREAQPGLRDLSLTLPLSGFR